jgi:hypothetical protein
VREFTEEEMDREMPPRDEADFELLLLEETTKREDRFKNPTLLAALRERNERHAKQMEATALRKHDPEVKQFFINLAAALREEYK